MMTCLAIDDEALSLDLLEDNIKKIPFLKLIRKCNNAIEANQFLQSQSVDLIFLDIQMPGLTGIQFLQGFSRTPPLIIFVTAYEQYAIEGYNLDVVDYLLKPVSFERFFKAMNKAQEKYQTRKSNHMHVPVEYLFVNSEYNLVRIDFKDIAYVKGLKDYVKIYLTSSARPVITRMSMKSLEEKLAPDHFIRVHKSYIIAIDKITSIRKGRINIMKEVIPISDHFKDNLYRFINPQSIPVINS
ncbi:MAG: LytR/AlgR family response regulator transcription factor [Bacteroidota bacterium]